MDPLRSPGVSLPRSDASFQTEVPGDSTKPRPATRPTGPTILLAPSFTRPAPSSCPSISLSSSIQTPTGWLPRSPPRRFVVLRRNPQQFLRTFSISSDMYKDVGVSVPGLGDEGDQRGAQKRTSGAHDKGGRPVGTRRFTRETLPMGCLKALSMALSQYGVERFLVKVKERTTCTLTVEDQSARVSSTASVPCRGDVWPLMHVFGALSKFEGGAASVHGQRDVACTWVGRNGYINCSCQGRTRVLGMMRRPHADAEDVDRTHGLAMENAVRKLARTLGVDVRSVRSVAGNLHNRCQSRQPAAVEGDWGDDGDCERFVVGQSVFGVAVTGFGDQVTAAPVKFTRKTTTCMLCDTAHTSPCSHVKLMRHYKRLTEAKDKSAAAAEQQGCTTDDTAVGPDDA